MTTTEITAQGQDANGEFHVENLPSLKLINGHPTLTVRFDEAGALQQPVIDFIDDFINGANEDAVLNVHTPVKEILDHFISYAALSSDHGEGDVFEEQDRPLLEATLKDLEALVARMKEFKYVPNLPVE